MESVEITHQILLFFEEVMKIQMTNCLIISVTALSVFIAD